MTKPIAWMASNELLFSVVKDEIYHIPLYTQRELTDEEIQEIGKPFLGYVTFDELDFARAILKKAREKCTK
jgi:hypothetical protein